MKHFDVRRYAVSACAAVALLAGCGGSQPPIGAPGTMPQGSASHLPNAGRYAVLFEFGASSGPCVDGAYPTWGLVPIKGLLYGPTYEGGTEYGGTVFRPTPDGLEHVVSDFNNYYGGAAGPSGLVADDGHLYGTRTAFHGGPPYGEPFGRAIFSLHNDGKIRVLRTFGKGYDGSEPARPPYDASGDSFFIGSRFGNKQQLSELPNGSSQFINITADARVDVECGLQWDDGLLTGTSDTKKRFIYQFQVSGQKPTRSARHRSARQHGSCLTTSLMVKPSSYQTFKKPMQVKSCITNTLKADRRCLPFQGILALAPSWLVARRDE